LLIAIAAGALAAGATENWLDNNRPIRPNPDDPDFRYINDGDDGTLPPRDNDGGFIGDPDTDFYRLPNGDLIPKTGYRYLSSDSPHVNSLISNGEIPYNSDPTGTYFTFDRYDSPQIARDRLQLPRSNDASIRIEFDTAQILGDIRVPNGRRGTNGIPEPTAATYPEYGSGGGTQRITNQPIRVRQATNLRTREVLYVRQ
jgi:hypothetical protein